jgi:hypothetical protein
MQRREQPGAAGAEDQNVGLEVLDVHCLTRILRDAPFRRSSG